MADERNGMQADGLVLRGWLALGKSWCASGGPIDPRSVIRYSRQDCAGFHAVGTEKSPA